MSHDLYLTSFVHISTSNRYFSLINHSVEYTYDDPVAYNLLNIAHCIPYALSRDEWSNTAFFYFLKYIYKLLILAMTAKLSYRCCVPTYVRSRFLPPPPTRFIPVVATAKSTGQFNHSCEREIIEFGVQRSSNFAAKLMASFSGGIPS